VVDVPFNRFDKALLEILVRFPFQLLPRKRGIDGITPIAA
jgi:hypothetical protein